MIELPLTKDMIAFIDDADYPRVGVHKWYATYCRGKWYAATSLPWTINTKGKRVRPKLYLHRLIANPPSSTLHVDHFNGNGLDCQRDNLFVCNYVWNTHNTNREVGFSGFRGVERMGRLWRASITFEGVRYREHGFETAAQAAREYDAMAIKYHGPFAKTNAREGRFANEGVPTVVMSEAPVADIPF